MKRVVLAISSGGGHWVQMRRLAPAFEGHEVVYATVNRGYQSEVSPMRFYVVPDVTRWDRLRWGLLLGRVFWILLRVKPDVIVTTGAGPGYVAVRVGRILRIRSIWIDSLANVERLSMAGEKVGPYVDLWLTQWRHLAREKGPYYFGGVM